MELYNRKEAGKILGVKPQTVYSWERQGKINPILYINTRPRYSLDSLQQVATEKSNKKTMRQGAQ